MRYAMHESESPGGELFDETRGCPRFAQRVLRFGPGRSGARFADGADEVLYVLAGSATATIDGAVHEVRPGTAAFVARGTTWAVAPAETLVVLSVLVPDPEEPDARHAVLDLAAEGTHDATAGRQFRLGATPATGCNSVTQFVGFVPPGRAPDHFHRYDEVIYILAGEGMLHVGGERASLRPGSALHLPARLVHSVENTGANDLRLLGVFRPAGSPAEAYYPDGTLAVLPEEA